MLDTQGSAQTAGAALAAQNQPHPGRIHKPNPAQIEHQCFGGAGQKGIVQLDAQVLCGIVVDLTCQIGIEQIVRRTECNCCHFLSFPCVNRSGLSGLPEASPFREVGRAKHSPSGFL